MSDTTPADTLPATVPAATAPPEARGLARDEVRLMVSSPASIVHTRFRRLADHLERGDLLVVNTSATIPAAVTGHRKNGDGPPVVIHFSSPEPAGRWMVELRDAQLHRVHDARTREQIRLAHGILLTLQEPWPDARQRVGSRLWLADVAVESGVVAFLEREGRPIAYDHLHRSWPLSDYQTIFARDPGSAEMVSASRPFSARVLADLHRRGIAVASLTLHTGVSSLEAGERPLPERYEVPPRTAEAVNRTRARGGRIVAVGTTVTRALETVAATDGTMHADAGLTDVVVEPARPARIVNGLITGWHEPQASHLLLLRAVAGDELVQRAYAAALDPANGGYLWHEFGDSCLFLP